MTDTTQTTIPGIAAAPEVPAVAPKVAVQLGASYTFTTVRKFSPVQTGTLTAVEDTKKGQWFVFAVEGVKKPVKTRFAKVIALA